MNHPQLKKRDRMIAVFRCILEQETSTGTTFIKTVPDKAPYIVVGLSNQALHLPKHGRGADEFFAYLYQRYGINEREEVTKFIYDCIRSHAFQYGAEVELRRFAFFDRKEQVLYLSRYDGTAYRLDGGEIRIVRNGEGVYFADDDAGVHCPNVEIGAHDLLLDRLTGLSYAEDTPGGITPDLQRKAITVWLFALAFPDLMPTKPLLLFEGGAGSGKSSASQFIQLALMGAKKPMILQKNKEDDFGVILLRSPIAVFDNTDSFIEWVPDAVCSYTTSGMWTKRKLFSDNEEITIKPHAFIAIASKNPASFRREDTADRCILIRLQRITGNLRQEGLESAILRQRGKILGEYLYFVNEIIRRVREGAMDKEPELGEDESGEPIQKSFRMADFASLAFVVGDVLGWKPRETLDLLDALESERDAFINEEDPLMEVMHEWLAKKVPGRPWNIGRLVTAQELYTELNQLAQEGHRQFYKTSRQLVQKMRSPHMDNEFTVVQTKLNKHVAYKIWRKTDGKLSVVPNDDKGSGGGVTFTGGGISIAGFVKTNIAVVEDPDE